MTVPKRHHFLPRFYLEKFCRDGMLWTYDRVDNAFHRQPPVNTAVMKDYYTFVEADGTKNLEIEAVLSRVEGETRPILDKVDRRELLSSEEKGTLALFVAFLLARVPDFEQTVTEMADHAMKHVASVAFSSVEKTKEMVESGEFQRNPTSRRLLKSSSNLFRRRTTASS